MQQNLSGSLRLFSREKHAHNQWRSRMPVTIGMLTPLIDFCSFKHAGISRLAKMCRPGHIIIDLGCGNGTYSRYLASQCPCTVIAVDWSPEALRKIKRIGNPSIKAVCADCHALPFKDSTLHGLFTIDVFGHLHDQSKVLREIHRVVRDGSPLFFHSECSDYKNRWPDRTLISRNKKDIPAEFDGHISLLKSRDIIDHLKCCFRVLHSFSPPGHAGWILGYPEKYVTAFQQADMRFPLLASSLTSAIKSVLPGRIILRFINALFDKFELATGMSGGGSVFADLIKPQIHHNKQPSIDIIIPSYNRSNELFSLCEHLLAQCRLNDTITVVSQDTLQPHLPESPRIHTIFSSPPNLPRARNRGIAATAGDIILFLDDDVTPDKNLLEHHRRLHSDKKIHCIAGSIHDRRFEETTECPSLFDITRGTCQQNFSFQSDCNTISFMGAHFSLRRSSLSESLSFDPHFKKNAYWEDIDFSFRLLKAGIPITYATLPVVTHHFKPKGGTRSSSTTGYLFDYFANTTYFACKYMPVQYLKGWYHHWKYRLEFESRSDSYKPLKHNPLLVAAGCLGALTGVFRFLIQGKRIGLPEQVISHWNSTQNGVRP
jgi:GT2 family glycosyltransferase/SAM-dependent methyltransferase